MAGERPSSGKKRKRGGGRSGREKEGKSQTHDGGFRGGREHCHRAAAREIHGGARGGKETTCGEGVSGEKSFLLGGGSLRQGGRYLEKFKMKISLLSILRDAETKEGLRIQTQKGKSQREGIRGRKKHRRNSHAHLRKKSPPPKENQEGGNRLKGGRTLGDISVY